MELWIRSQDKEVLLNIKGIQYQNYKLVENETVEANILIGFYNYYDNEILGEYETKERAIEILDEIQDELIGSDFMPIEKNEEVVLTCGSAKIYEMPKKVKGRRI
jgi:hypothetical protein